MDAVSFNESNETPICSSQNIQPKSRIHSTRTSCKEVQSFESSAESKVECSEKCRKNGLVHRNNSRGQKRIQKNITKNASVKKAVSLKKNASLDSKARRPWELWSVDDKNSFFEALCEYGKDFESIQSYIAQKSRKKGIPTNMIKNKDQVRHFYYRTWHKISRYVKVHDEVRKQTQEIYGLANYAELRKKIGGCLNEKNGQKLNELVFNGVTTVKYKGKKLRIKTPVCRALKKLTSIAEPKVEKLPKEIVLELKPCSNQAWYLVQIMSQNPRVRTKISLQHRLKSVIQFLQQKWKPMWIKKRESIIRCLHHTNDETFPDDDFPVLRVKPSNELIIAPISVSVMDNASSSDVCLAKYMKISHGNKFREDELKIKKSRLKVKSQNKNAVARNFDQTAIIRSEKVIESSFKDDDRITVDESYNNGLLTPPKSVEAEECCENVVDEAQRSLSLLSSMLNTNCRTSSCDFNVLTSRNFTGFSTEEQSECFSDENMDFPAIKPLECDLFDEMCFHPCQNKNALTLGQLLTLNPSNEISEDQATQIEKRDSTVRAIQENTDNLGFNTSSEAYDARNKELMMENFKNGWTADNVGLLTIGELYIMLGQPGKLLLEYEFESPRKRFKESKAKFFFPCFYTTDVMRKLVGMAMNAFTELKSKQASSALPTFRSTGSFRLNNNLQENKAPVRYVGKSSNLRTALRLSATSSECIESVFHSFPAIPSISTTGGHTFRNSKSSESDVCYTTNSLNTVCSDGMPNTENHVFVVPIGTAPKTLKKPSQESLREEIDKLLPSTRRGCRVRRKPLVVQRPLLPRNDIKTRPMAVLHLLPSGSHLASVVPPHPNSAENEQPMLSEKKVVKIFSSGLPVDVRPLQVKPVPSESNQNFIFQKNNMQSAQLMISRENSCSIIQNMNCENVSVMPSLSSAVNTCTVISTINQSPVIISPSRDVHSHAKDEVSSLSREYLLLTNSKYGVRAEETAATNSASPPQISIPEHPFSADGGVSMFLQLSLTDALKPAPSKTVLTVDETQHKCDSTISSSSSENTPPQSPPQIHSLGSDTQWLNGEVDRHVHCLLEESSVDFIAKFGDLADVFSSSNDGVKQT